MSDVFISYAHSDSLIVNILKDRLLGMGVSTFVYPDYLPVGIDTEARIREEIELVSRIREEIESAEVVLVIWSTAAADSKGVKQELDFALEAWENEKLILVRIDDAELPLGLGDLQAIQIPAGSLPEEAATTIIHEAQRRLRRTIPASSAPALPKGAPARPASKIILATLLTFNLLIVGLGYWFVTGPTLEPAPPPPSESPTTQPEPPPAPWRPELSVPAIATVEMIAGLVVIITVVVLILASGFFLLRGRYSIPWRVATPAQIQNKEQRGDAGSPPQGAIFVSYSRDDGPKVTIIVDELEQSGLRTWIDTRRESDAQRFARPIVQAIRASKACAFMCSPTAYRSDHVVRELYLADKYGKPIIPVEIEPDALPEDFEYFFSGLDVVPAKPVDRCVQAIVRRLQSTG